MNLGSSTFVQNVFRGYYAEDCNTQNFVMATEKREFGFVLFKGGMLRHRSFKDQRELALFLKSYVPSNAYYSCAYYVDPEAEMEKKDWIGADLVFDIDADHIPTTCGKVHDEWTCGVCGFVGKGITPDECPTCGGQKFEVKTWPCEKCLESAKSETIKLLDMLQTDFGFSQNETHAFFSGHRGYHVHVESDVVQKLDTMARKEIVDYVTGLGFNDGFNNSDHKKRIESRFPTAPRLGDYGWRGRLARGMYDLILSSKEEDLEKVEVPKRISELILRNKNAILKSWEDVGPYRAVKGVGLETWRKIVEHCVAILTAKIDTVVTTDIHRLIRLTGALHGKTGLKKIECPISDIQAFDPFKNAVAFKEGAATVSVSNVPEFRLGEEIFGPFKNQKVELPTAAAVLIVCKGRGEVVDYNVQ